ncbi:Putative ribonuclease H protein At1g65750 [Linum perenne]
MIWGPDPRGRFSISSTYEIAAAINFDSDTNLWKCVWKWQGPNRIKHFLWLVAHNRLLTNLERKKRHLTAEEYCRLCPNSTEDSLHIGRRRRETLISWIPAPDDWITLNMDGSVLQPQSQAAGGGIVRDSHENKIAAFLANFGRCSIMQAELRAAALGLETAWDSGCRKVNIQLDSKAAIDAINGDPSSAGRHCQTLQRIRNLCNREWEVVVTHIFREGNRVADLLAHQGHSLAFGCHHLAVCNPNIRFGLFSDCIGTSIPIMIPLNN